MATYKLIQDIEAEDKILGPLTLRQFIFAMIAIFLFYICFILVVKNVAFLLVLFLPPALFFGFFALPFGRDQPTEIWALAKMRYWFKPRRRVWNQSGVKELVTITVPKKVERILTNGLSQTEVKSRLQALADTIDSRGWATKHASTNTYSYSPQPVIGASSERLIDIASLPQEVPIDGVVAADDIMDETSNPIARQFDTMINQSSHDRRQRLVEQLNDPTALAERPVVTQAGGSADKWFMPQDHAMALPAPVPPVSVTTDPAAEAALSARLAARANSGQVSFGNLRTVQPLSTQAQAAPLDSVTPINPTDPPPQTRPTEASSSPTSAMTAPSDPAILSLAKNDDLNVATLAREARKNRDNNSQLQNEVVISLH